MHKTIFTLALVAVVGVLVFSPLLAVAQNGFHFVPCGRSDQAGTPDAQCQFRHIIILIVRVINYLITVAAFVAMYHVLLGGWDLMTSVGNSEKIEKAKKGISNAVVGFGIVVIGFVFVNLLLNGIFNLGPGKTREWWKLSCIYGIGEGECPTGVSGVQPIESGGERGGEEGGGVRGQAVAPVVISPNGGAYAGGQITLSTATAGAEIYYTIDGSAPGINARRYSAPFTITAPATVKAVAYKQGLNPSPVSSASFTRPASVGPAPEIVRLSPNSVFAGTADGIATGGVTIYKPNDLTLTIEGKNLEGARVSTNAASGDLEGGAGIVLKSGMRKKGVTTSGNDLYEIDISVLPSLDARGVAVTVTNQHGKSSTVALNIKITGTQWLKRQFPQAQSRIKFLGDWPEEAPNARVQGLAERISRGLSVTSTTAYKNLNIWINIYEDKYWTNVNRAVCGNPPFDSAGCARASDNVIEIGERLPMFATMFHESVHKLHFYYNGIYRPVPITATRFQSDWITAVGNLSTCPYLPLKDKLTWKNGEQSAPRCGFILAYGASDPPLYYEDVATMAESSLFSPTLFTDPEVKSDPRYKQKLDLLEQYKFIQSSALGLTDKRVGAIIRSLMRRDL